MICKLQKPRSKKTKKGILEILKQRFSKAVYKAARLPSQVSGMRRGGEGPPLHKDLERKTAGHDRGGVDQGSFFVNPEWVSNRVCHQPHEAHLWEARPVR